MAAPNIITLTQDNFAKEVVESPGPILVDFWAEWCGPCKMLAPILDELAAEYEGRVRIGKVNIDEHGPLAAQFNIQSIPTLLLFLKGQVTEQFVGLRGKKDLKTRLDRVAG
ncbi:MAG: thioredoxin [Limisphaerales bacterium]